MIDGIGDALRNWWLVLRCSAIGIYVGMLPGLGGAIVDWVAYGHMAQSSKDKSMLGKGDVRGVIAPETANNAMKGAALIPTLAFGIPGSPPMAILLGALTIQGLTPGPAMLTTELHITFSLVWTLVIANIIGAGLLMLWANQLARLTFVTGHLIVPAVVLFVFMGAWMSGNDIGDWMTVMAFGILGYLMKESGLPRPPLILGFILGPIMENSLFITNQAYGTTGWLLRPVCVVLVCLVVGTVVYSALSGQHRRRAVVQTGSDTPQAPDPRWSLPLVVVILAWSMYSTWRAFDWPFDAAMFPVAIGVPAILLSLLGVFVDWGALVRRRAILSTSSTTFWVRSCLSRPFSLCSARRLSSASASPCLCSSRATWSFGKDSVAVRPALRGNMLADPSGHVRSNGARSLVSVPSLWLSTESDGRLRTTLGKIF